MFDPDKMRMLIPRYPIDKIIGVFEGDLHVNAPTAVQQKLYTEELIPHPFGDTVETQLIYSTGGDFNDQDMTVPRLTGSVPVFQTLDVTSYSSSSNIVVATTNHYDNVAGAGFAYDITYKIFLIAKKNQGIIEPLPTNQIIRYRSSDNYLKIADWDIIDRTIPTGTSTYTINHNLNRILTSRASIEYESSGKLWGISPNQYLATGGLTYNNPITTKTTINSTSVTYSFANAEASPIDIKLHYRLYYDS